MNKTLQYILIFAICFAVAALLGRLFKGKTEEHKEFLESMEAQKDLIHPKWDSAYERTDQSHYKYDGDSVNYEFHTSYSYTDRHIDTLNVFKSDNQLVVVSGSGRDEAFYRVAGIKNDNHELRLWSERKLEKDNFDISDNSTSFSSCDCYFISFSKYTIKYPQAYNKIYLHDSLIWTNK